MVEFDTPVPDADNAADDSGYESGGGYNKTVRDFRHKPMTLPNGFNTYGLDYDSRNPGAFYKQHAMREFDTSRYQPTGLTSSDEVMFAFPHREPHESKEWYYTGEAALKRFPDLTQAEIDNAYKRIRSESGFWQAEAQALGGIILPDDLEDAPGNIQRQYKKDAYAKKLIAHGVKNVKFYDGVYVNKETKQRILPEELAYIDTDFGKRARTFAYLHEDRAGTHAPDIAYKVARGVIETDFLNDDTINLSAADLAQAYAGKDLEIKNPIGSYVPYDLVGEEKAQHVLESNQLRKTPFNRDLPRAVVDVGDYLVDVQEIIRAYPEHELVQDIMLSRKSALDKILLLEPRARNTYVKANTLKYMSRREGTNSFERAVEEAGFDEDWGYPDPKDPENIHYRGTRPVLPTIKFYVGGDTISGYEQGLQHLGPGQSFEDLYRQNEIMVPTKNKKGNWTGNYKNLAACIAQNVHIAPEVIKQLQGFAPNRPVFGRLPHEQKLNTNGHHNRRQNGGYQQNHSRQSQPLRGWQDVTNESNNLPYQPVRDWHNGWGHQEKTSRQRGTKRSAWNRQENTYSQTNYDSDNPWNQLANKKRKYKTTENEHTQNQTPLPVSQTQTPVSSQPAQYQQSQMQSSPAQPDPVKGAGFHGNVPMTPPPTQSQQTYAPSPYVPEVDRDGDLIDLEQQVTPASSQVTAQNRGRSREASPTGTRGHSGYRDRSQTDIRGYLKRSNGRDGGIDY